MTGVVDIELVAAGDQGGMTGADGNGMLYVCSHHNHWESEMMAVSIGVEDNDAEYNADQDDEDAGDNNDKWLSTRSSSSSWSAV